MEKIEGHELLDNPANREVKKKGHDKQKKENPSLPRRSAPGEQLKIGKESKKENPKPELETGHRGVKKLSAPETGKLQKDPVSKTESAKELKRQIDELNKELQQIYAERGKKVLPEKRNESMPSEPEKKEAVKKSGNEENTSFLKKLGGGLLAGGEAVLKGGKAVGGILAGIFTLIVGVAYYAVKYAFRFVKKLVEKGGKITFDDARDIFKEEKTGN